MRHLLALAVCLLLFLVGADELSAQQGPCPPGYIHRVQQIAVPALSCSVTVEYCTPDPANPPQGPSTMIEVLSFTTHPPCFPGGISPYQLSKLWEELIKNEPTINCTNHNDCGSFCKEHPHCFCTGGTATWEVRFGNCVKPISNPDGTVEYIPCPVLPPGGQHLRCLSLYQVCCVDGNIDATFLGMGSDGQCSSTQMNSGCIFMCANMPGNLSCCDGEGRTVDPCPGPGQDENTPPSQRTGPCPSQTTGDCPQYSGISDISDPDSSGAESVVAAVTAAVAERNCNCPHRQEVRDKIEDSVSH